MTVVMTDAGPAAATTLRSGLQRKSVATATIGNILEWYDFIIFAYFAAIIAPKFFPSSDETASLLSTLAVFGIGFVARPIGGILIGRFADVKGRKPALLLTIFLMASSTVLIGLTPSFASIGLFAPMILTVARLVQGFSAGGEWGSATAYLVEWAPAGKRGFYGSFQNFTIIAGVLLGSGVAALFTTFVPKDVLGDWVWRVPFLLGGVLGVIGVVMRISILETPAFRVDDTPSVASGSELWVLGWRVFAISAIPHSLFYVGFAYLPTFVQTYAHLDRSSALWANTMGLGFVLLFLPFVGALSDKVGRMPLLIASAIATVVLPYPLVQAILASPGFFTVLGVQIVLALVYATISATIQPAYVEMLPNRTRLFLMSTAYNLAGVVFGAFAPYISVWAIQKTGMPVSISYLVITGGLICCLGLINLKEMLNKPLR